MKAYWVLNYNITNTEGFATYRAVASPLISKLVKDGKAKILVVNDKVTDDVLEGIPGNSLVVIEFLNKEEASKFYHSKEYQDMLSLRTDNSDGWAVLVEGY